MQIKINSYAIKRMMKVISQCTDKRSPTLGNVEISGDGQDLVMRSCNGAMCVEMRTPYLGLDAEAYCVDAEMFGKIVDRIPGDVSITVDARQCVIRGAGVTRIPVVKADIPRVQAVVGGTVEIDMEKFATAYDGVSYAVSDDASRMILTGVLAETDGHGGGKMAALDGFELSVEEVPCEGDAVRGVIPKKFFEMIVRGGLAEDKVRITVSDARAMAETDGMRIGCGLIHGEFPDYERLLPKDFKTECAVDVRVALDVLKSGGVINGHQNLVKLEVGEEGITFRNNAEAADFEAEVAGLTQGEGLKIAFNQKYLESALNAVRSEKAVLQFNGPSSACVVRGVGEDGVHMLLPVRVM